MVKKILLSIDHNDENSWKLALPVAMEQARFYDAELRAVSVIPEIIKLPNLPENYGDGAADHVRGIVTEILDKASVPKIGLHVLVGNVYREILKLAHKDDFDLIVMASAKGDFPNYEIGPNLARVVRNAHCSVLIVRS